MNDIYSKGDIYGPAVKLYKTERYEFRRVNHSFMRSKEALSSLDKVIDDLLQVRDRQDQLDCVCERFKDIKKMT